MPPPGAPMPPLPRRGGAPPGGGGNPAAGRCPPRRGGRCAGRRPVPPPRGARGRGGGGKRRRGDKCENSLRAFGPYFEILFGVGRFVVWLPWPPLSRARGIFIRHGSDGSHCAVLRTGAGARFSIDPSSPLSFETCSRKATRDAYARSPGWPSRWPSREPSISGSLQFRLQARLGAVTTHLYV